jgi:hypothetical protein
MKEYISEFYLYLKEKTKLKLELELDTMDIPKISDVTLYVFWEEQDFNLIWHYNDTIYIDTTYYCDEIKYIQELFLLFLLPKRNGYDNINISMYKK